MITPGCPASGGRYLQVGAGLFDLARDAVSAGRLGDRTRLGEQRTGIVVASVGGGDVGQPDQVRGHAGQEPDLPAQPGRLLQPLTRAVQTPGPVLGDAQVPKRLRHRAHVAGCVCEFARPFK
jgi:hypothetical protein